MAKQLNQYPNPFEHRDQLQKIEKLRASEKALNDKIQAVIDGEKPKDIMSWEFYIWMRHHDPFYKYGSRS
jgi:hypothetical protein